MKGKTTKRQRSLTTKETKFVANAGLGMSLTKASTHAGYTDGAQEVDRLLARPALRNELIDNLQKQAIRWPQLLSAALAAFWDVLSPQSVTCEHTCACGLTCGNVVYTPPKDVPLKLRVYTAKAVTDVLNRSGMAATLRDRAQNEDKPTKEQLVTRIVGPEMEDETEH